VDRLGGQDLEPDADELPATVVLPQSLGHAGPPGELC
jgi:hypothetical protein